MHFIPAAIEKLELRDGGKTPLSELGRQRKIYVDPKRGERYYSSDATQWAVYELLKDHLGIAPVVATSKYGFLSWEVPPDMFTEKPEEVYVGAEILALVFNDADHGEGKNILYNPKGDQEAIFDTEQAFLFWDGINDNMFNNKLKHLSEEKKKALHAKALELQQYFSSEEGLERIENVFAGKTTAGNTAVTTRDRIFKRSHEAERTPQEFQQEVLARLQRVIKATG